MQFPCESIDYVKGGVKKITPDFSPDKPANSYNRIPSDELRRLNAAVGKTVLDGS